MDQSRLDQLLNLYLDGMLSSDEKMELQATLRDDANARHQFWGHARFHGSLRLLSEQRSGASDAAPAETLRLSIESENDTTLSDRVAPAAAAEVQSEAAGNRVRQLARSPGWWAIVSVCLVAALWLNPQQSTTAVPKVAHLITSVDADWQGVAPELNTSLAAGDYQLNSGSIDLRFASGAKVSVSGPAAFELKSDRHIHLESGNLVARIPDEALGFVVTSPQSEVVDLGTEFGLRVGDDRQTEVHVIEGLVEVFEREGSSKRSGESILVEEGQAIRFNVNEADEVGSERIPVRSTHGVLGNRERSDLGLTFLQGNIRLKKSVARSELKRQTTSWIEVIPEKAGVVLEQDIPVTLISAGSYRLFGNTDLTLPEGIKVDSYLLHFRSTQPAPIRGVIKFDRKIVGLICEAGQLAGSDSIVGRDEVEYPVAAKRYRGLEPHVPMEGPEPTEGGGWSPDEVTVSKDMKTLGVSVNVNPGRGVDQLRVLVLSDD